MATPAKGKFDRLIEETRALREQDRAAEQREELERDLEMAGHAAGYLFTLGLRDMSKAITSLIERLK